MILPVCRVGLVVVHLQLRAGGSGDNGTGLFLGVLGLALDLRHWRDVVAGMGVGPVLEGHTFLLNIEITSGSVCPEKGGLMNIEEAIRLLTEWAEQCRYEAIRKAAGLAVDALRTQQEPNAPLTLGELREMDGEPVWCEEYQCFGLVSVENGGQWEGIPFFLNTKNGVRFNYNIAARELVLYRHKPEEVPHGNSAGTNL